MKNFILFFLFFTFIIAQTFAAKPKVIDPQILWNVQALKKGELLGQVYDQPLEENLFQVSQIKMKGLKILENNLLTLDVKTGTVAEKSAQELPNIKDIMKASMSINKTLLIDNYIFKTKFASKVIEIYKADPNDVIGNILGKVKKENMLYSLKIKLFRVEIEVNKENNMLFINNFGAVPQKELSVYNLQTGEELYSIKYQFADRATYYGLGGNRKPYYDISRSSNRLAIYNEYSDIFLYELSTGKEISKLYDAIKGADFSVFDASNDSELIYITENPYALRLVDINLGVVKSEVKFKSLGDADIGVIIKKFGDLFYVTCQDDKTLIDNAIYCIDIINSKLLWSKKLPSSHVYQLNEYDDSVLIFDNKNFYCLDKRSGNEKWKTPLKDPKDVIINGDTAYIGLGMGTSVLLNQEIGFSGLSKINLKDGSVIWSINNKTCISSGFTFNGNLINYADDKNVYIFDNEHGKEVYTEKIKTSVPINSSFFMKDLNQMFLLTKDSLMLYDFNNKKLLYTIKFKKDYFMVEFLRMGNTLFLTTIETAKFNPNTGNIIPKNMYRMAIDIKKGKINWDILFGLNYYLSTSILPDYLTGGTTPSKDSFFSRKENLKENYMVIAQTDQNLMMTNAMCFKIFNDNDIPTEEEINNSQSSIGVSSTVLVGKVMKIMLAKIKMIDL